MKCRLFKNKDGEVFFNWPSGKYQGGTFVKDESKQKELKFDDCKIPDDLKDFDFIIIHKNDLDKINRSEGGTLYFDGPCHINNLKFDQGWNIQLMSTFLISQKHIENKKLELDEELAIENPDPVKVVKLQLEIEKTKGLSDSAIYELALSNLDKKVSKGEEDKPVIRIKLESKINELK